MKNRVLRRPTDEAGFTLIELLVVIMLIGVLVTISATAMSTYAKIQQQRATTREIVAILRNTQQRAATEGRPYRCTFDNSNTATESMECRQGSTGGSITRLYNVSSQVDLIDIDFDSALPAPANQNRIIFTPRGTADGGSLKVTRPGSSKVYRITVEGLTGRVSYES